MFGLGLARLLPHGAMTCVVRGANFVRENRPRTSPLAPGRSHRSFEGRSVVVAGLFSTRSGLGRGARLLADDFKARGIPVHRVDLAPVLGLPATLPDPAAAAPEKAASIDASDLILVVNPPLFSDALKLFDKVWLQERCIVAHWVWELDRLPASWVKAANWCDEIWAASSFVAHAVQTSVPDRVPVRVVPYPVDTEAFAPASPAERQRIRQQLGIAPDAFCAGYSFSAASNYTRKNPEAAIAAFQSAFPPGDEGAVLLLRALDLGVYRRGRERLSGLAEEDPRIRLFDGERSHLAIGDLYACIDVYVAPFRSEGYGLNLVEASQAGNAVVATGWGLDGEILNRPRLESVPYALVPVVDPQGNYSRRLGACWAEPDVAFIASRLRSLREETSRAAGGSQIAT